MRGWLWIAASGLAAVAGGAFYLEGNDLWGDRDEEKAVVATLSPQEQQAHIAEAEKIAQRGIERARLTLDEALRPANDHYDREIARLEPAIAAGQLTREEAIELAVNRAAAASATAPQGAPPLAEEGARRALIEKARAGLQESHDGVDALLEAGKIERSVHDRLYRQISEVEERLDAQDEPPQE